MMRVPPRAVGVLIAVAAAGLGTPVLALDSTQAQGRAALQVRAVESEMGKIQAAAARARNRRTSPARRIAEGEILLRNRDYEHAIHLFHQVVELYEQGQAPATAHADALFLLGEAYFRDEQLLAARRYFTRLLDRAGDRPYASFAGRALSRLVDVCLRGGDLSGLGPLFASMGHLPDSDATGSLQYARGKALYARGDLAAASAALNAVPRNTPYAHQAGYLLGVLVTKQLTPTLQEPAPPAGGAVGGEGGADAAEQNLGGAQQPRLVDYTPAIAQFRKVTRLPPRSRAHRHVVDLAWMAIGRLYYEMERPLEAAHAYSHVDRKSPEFSNMLYELGWVYVRLGDFRRAQRALEIQRITDPQNMAAADGALLRADLLLRQGEYEQALGIYRSVRSRYEPIREQVERFLAANADADTYYDMLVDEQLGLGAHGTGLPPLVLQWAREHARQDRVFVLIDEVTRTRDLVTRARSLAVKLDSVLGSGTRAKAFPELRASLEATMGLLNKLGRARRLLALGLDEEARSEVGGELAVVRSQRRALMERMAWLPVTPGDFARRERSGKQQWNRISQRLQRLTLATDRLQAIINALDRVVREAQQHGAAPDPARRERIGGEIEQHERKLGEFRARIRQYEEAVDAARAQIGFGDRRFQVDRRVREQFRRLFWREVQLVAAGADASDAAEYSSSIRPLLARADQAEAYLKGVEQQLEQAAASGAAALRAEVRREAAAIEEYATSLSSLDEEARSLVGQVAMDSFAGVRDRLRDIVLRADVGVVQQAWRVREEQRSQVQSLYRERTREEQKINDELREALESAGDDEP